ncbi:DUF3572 family protein [Sphingomonas carotinifaciens]|uniref:DUF3572 family protein n=1 Tax=Sphingomonas carotinifaciens TaxID=1166323 RepID=A0A1G7NB37_9SPHN|nr:DUF3572 family protein [Sphingomonas carotinifaciens]MBB4087162.1 hypothetical protein [Sphingomonas carotinifaciens]MWC43152.1 DUF3572 family protein [Sphingomonas carotinifaciens]SDF70579.1 Protein of unknown function [Sphingomonas carotinifaciens]
MAEPDTIDDAEALALHALVWTLGQQERAERLLATTGLTPADLRARARAGDRAVLAAVLGFLAAHEPDLIACADALDIRPEALARALTLLEFR